VIFILKRKE